MTAQISGYLCFNYRKWSGPVPVAARSVAARLLRLWVQIPSTARASTSSRFVCCQVEVSASGWSLVQRSPTECGDTECDHEDLIMRPWASQTFRLEPVNLWLSYHGSVTCRLSYNGIVTCSLSYNRSVTCRLSYNRSVTCRLSYNGSVTCRFQNTKTKDKDCSSFLFNSIFPTQFKYLIKSN
jgi:hypothetical protein